jgi:hypothetical protein
MKIGYSCWGFLGNGITDTPDGGRSHRRPLIDELIARGHDIVFLQADRDRLEAGDDLGGGYVFDDDLPDIDVLFLEWRWPIPGRNTTDCQNPGHTCDLHRQAQLLRSYTLGRTTPTVIWDKDRRLSGDSAWRRTPQVAVCEAALEPTPGAHRLLFPLADTLLDSADPHALARVPRPVSLTYIGNQYDRDDPFDRYFAPAAACFPHRVAGKWPDLVRWPHISFLGRIGFQDVARLYGESLATVLLLPERYAATGQMTQRIFEAVTAGCVALAPADIAHADRFVPGELIVASASEVVQRVTALRTIAGTEQHADLIATCLARLELFRLSHQADALQAALDTVTSSTGTRRGAA